MDDQKQDAADKVASGEMRSQADQVLEELGIPIAGKYCCVKTDGALE